MTEHKVNGQHSIKSNVVTIIMRLNNNATPLDSNNALLRIGIFSNNNSKI